MITAAAGHGKTSFCKWRVLESIRELESRTSDCLPFYVPLHQLAVQELDGTPEEIFLHDPALVRHFQELCSAGKRASVFFDGLDEVTTIQRQRDLLEAAKNLSERYPMVSVVVTARDHVGGSWLSWLSRIELSEMSEEQAETLVGKWLGDKSEDYSAFFTQLEQARTLTSLIRIPLLCTLIIGVFRRNRELPQSRARLYDIVTELMCGGWDLAKNIPRNLKFGSDQKREVLTRLAGILHMNRRREATEREFQLAVDDVWRTSLPNWRVLLSEVLEDSLLTRVGGELTFSHLSFQEYLAARDLGDPSGNRQKNALRAYLRGDDWWAEVLSFYIASSSRPLEMKKWAEAEALKTVGRRMQEERLTRLFGHPS
ncbi:MAG TPA: NACHT domain-containing protein [Acidobacteriaceae bacterium]|nr:NACHT domain-containing protein [Acidobacteriaceae bacterium]